MSVSSVGGSSGSSSSHESSRSHESDDSDESSESSESSETHESGSTSESEETRETEGPDEEDRAEEAPHPDHVRPDDDTYAPTDDAGKKEAQEKLLGAPAPDETGDGFTGSNYMDTGLVPGPDGKPLDPRVTTDGDPTQDPKVLSSAEKVRADIQADLKALHDDGIDTVRVFVQPPGGFSEAEDGYYEKVTARMQMIAEEADKLDMRVTIDLLNDGDGKGEGMVKYEQEAWSGQLDSLTDQVVPNLKGYDNVDWSLGNELKAPNDPDAFCDWYVDKARALRENMGTGQRIIAQMTPGALGHPDYVTEEPPRPGALGPPYFPTSTNTAAYQSMLRIANASDVVSIHFYPPTAEQDLPAIIGGGLQPRSDWASVRAWQQAAAEAPNPARFEIGEFSVPRDTYLPHEVQQGLAKTTEDYKTIADGWVHKLHDMGVQKVSFWQYQKPEDGFGTDPTSWDQKDNVKDGKEYLHVSAGDMQPLVKQWSLLAPIRG